jgi:hypothetical protein
MAHTALTPPTYVWIFLRSQNINIKNLIISEILIFFLFVFSKISIIGIYTFVFYNEVRSVCLPMKFPISWDKLPASISYDWTNTSVVVNSQDKCCL